MLWIISGPSSAGTSTLIESGDAGVITGLAPDTPTLFPRQFDPSECDPRGQYYLHYNILKPYHLPPISDLSCGFTRRLCHFLWDRVPGSGPSYWRYIKDQWRYRNDSAWRRLAACDLRKKAIVLIASKHLLIERASKRTVTEKNTLYGKETPPYPTEYWVRAYRRVDLYEIYAAWFAELTRNHIEYILLDCSDPRWSRLDECRLSRSLINS